MHKELKFNLQSMASAYPRVAVFPVVFCVSLVSLSIAYFNRKKLFPEVWVLKRQQAIESHEQALRFKSLVAEGVEKERNIIRNEK